MVRLLGIRTEWVNRGDNGGCAYEPDSAFVYEQQGKGTRASRQSPESGYLAPSIRTDREGPRVIRYGRISVPADYRCGIQPRVPRSGNAKCSDLPEFCTKVLRY